MSSISAIEQRRDKRKRESESDDIEDYTLERPPDKSSSVKEKIDIYEARNSPVVDLRLMHKKTSMKPKSSTVNILARLRALAHHGCIFHSSGN